MKKIIFFVVCLLISASVFSQDSLDHSISQNDSIIASKNAKLGERSIGKTMTKTNGDSAYIKNDYATAIQIYESLLKKGESANIYYNLGNSYYKSGEIAKAILNYERALLLQPGNNDIRSNLDIARSKTIDKVEPIPELFFITWIKAIINIMNIDAWAVCGIVSFIFFVIAIYFFFFSSRISYKKICFISGILFFIISVLSNVFAFYQKSILENRNSAIVMLPSVTIRSTPSENGTSLFILHEGRKVIIKDATMKEWKEIQLEDGKVGWIKTDEIEII
ncbi:tetratricopeptide repeat protein [uncultured Bacteroides sp.]|uniref:tetratricopeptide repeat protein n=1 Tax=uncultured Bacteroides sp. TaxID=162156 RepID=UPI002AAB96E5|nr:tetratricopeptide repeat protein [uncultured Bacteroides sp.]